MEADYVIVGAGSAGCVLADKLSENPRNRVLLIEAGPEDRSPFVRIPKGFGKLLRDPKHVWVFPTEPEAGNAGKPEYWVRGRMLGGSSSVNGMIYMRGQARDYDDWASHGLKGWSWREVAPYFQGMEDHVLGADELRGAGGPLRVGHSCGARYPLGEAVIEAGRALGVPVKSDINRPDNEGIAWLCATIHGGRRQSSAEAFLKPIRSRPNLHVVTDTLAHRVVFQGTRAIGITAVHGEAQVHYRAHREVILSAGALQSPKLLQLSGIGPAEYLRSLGVQVLVDSPDVGANMREHRLLFVQSGYHACGTCRMGVDSRAVLDERLRVRGVSGLRVADLSFFPSLISGNTNGPAMALAWRAADLILEDAR